jgi:hypothetical protein
MLKNKALTVRRKITSAGLLLMIFIALSSCSKNSGKWKSSEMSDLTPRLQKYFEKNKAVCFGRFMIDVPDSTIISWGKVAVPYTMQVYPQGVGKVHEEAQKFIDELKSEKAIYHNKVPLLLAVEEIKEPEGMMVVGYEGFEAIAELNIRAYFRMNQDGVIINSRPFKREKDEVMLDLLDTARRLKPRLENEIPSEPGNCIEYAFLKEKKNPSEDDLFEHIRIGIRLKEFPDVHLSIYVAPANDNPEDDSLASQWEAAKGDMTSINEKIVLGKTKFFRESKRQIHDWKTGYEVMIRSPDEDGSLSHHDFHLRFNGVPRDPYKPYADIKLETGVANNAAGATKASLTDEEAIAIWDKITSSIRVRPTGDKAVKTIDANAIKQRPLGELAATGRTCPQTGWWEASEEDEIAGNRRRHLQAGEPMPHAVSLGKPSIWEKLKGEQPSYRTATVWKLVSYDEEPGQAKAPASTPAMAQTRPAGAGPAKTDDHEPNRESGSDADADQKG